MTLLMNPKQQDYDFDPTSAAAWVVVKIRVPFWFPNIVRHLLFREPKKGPLF